MQANTFQNEAMAADPVLMVRSSEVALPAQRLKQRHCGSDAQCVPAFHHHHHHHRRPECG